MGQQYQAAGYLLQILRRGASAKEIKYTATFTSNRITRMFPKLKIQLLYGQNSVISLPPTPAACQILRRVASAAHRKPQEALSLQMRVLTRHSRGKPATDEVTGYLGNLSPFRVKCYSERKKCDNSRLIYSQRVYINGQGLTKTANYNTKVLYSVNSE